MRISVYCELFIVLSLQRGATSEESKKVIQLLGDLLSRHDPMIRPYAGGEAVNVTVGIHVVSFGSINEMNMEYTVDIFLRQLWDDPRMIYNVPSVPYVTANAVAIPKLWVPDVYFVNEKQASFHQITLPNKLIKIYPNGTVVYSARITMTLSCPMDLTNFPMDEQMCDLELESYGYDSGDMSLEWLPNSLTFAETVELPQFQLMDIKSLHCDRDYPVGHFSCLRIEFHMQRQFGYYLLQTYIPTVLIVVISWVSFWITADAAPARITLGVTTVLTMTTQLSGAKANLPRVSYPKSIDVWMAACMIFVFAALLEYAFVNSAERKAKRHRTSVAYDATAASRKKEKSVCNSLCCQDNIDMHRRIDKASRVLFPSAFIIFNILYWGIYFTPRWTIKKE